MRTITQQVFKFSELNEEAQARAIEWARENEDTSFYADEGIASVKAFADQFGVSLTNWQIGAWSHSFINTDATPANFRGVKLSQAIESDGYYVGEILRDEFKAYFIQSTDAHDAFNRAIDYAVRAIVDDLEYRESDEALIEMIEANEYEFFENGAIFV